MGIPPDCLICDKSQAFYRGPGHYICDACMPFYPKYKEMEAKVYSGRSYKYKMQNLVEYIFQFIIGQEGENVTLPRNLLNDLWDNVPHEYEKEWVNFQGIRLSQSIMIRLLAEAFKKNHKSVDALKNFREHLEKYYDDKHWDIELKSFEDVLEEIRNLPKTGQT